MFGLNLLTANGNVKTFVAQKSLTAWKFLTDVLDRSDTFNVVSF